MLYNTRPSDSESPWLYSKSPPIPSNSALFEGTAILSGVRNHSVCSQGHSFNPTLHCKTSVRPMYTQRLDNPIMHCESRAPNEFLRLDRRWRPQLNHPFIYFRSARPWRNTTRVQINSKLTILYIISVTEFKINPLNVLLERTVSNDY